MPRIVRLMINEEIRSTSTTRIVAFEMERHSEEEKEGGQPPRQDRNYCLQPQNFSIEEALSNQSAWLAT